MLRTLTVLLACLVLLPAAFPAQEAPDPRMDWWREARFGLFIHWGLYAIPAGEWKGKTNHGEWIMHSGRIPVPEYEKLLARFNPVKYDADAWVRAAKDAGMRYIVVTSKHHDGFALYPSKVSDYDVEATPFKRDILAELQKACEEHGLRLCFYHSIMDWHHPDYLPRRGWEKRSAEGADYARYVAYMKAQVKELLTGYGDIGVVWFDGEWEGTWTHEHGLDLYAYCRSLKPDVIVNNRVDKGRGGMAGLTSPGFMGDFGTPEQEIPDRGLPPGVDWETCMTMNRHWGWNKHDDRWKSSRDLIRKLVDIASKGGNFLLNVGPTDTGEFPAASLERLAAMGRWMKVNGAAIYGTGASPFGKFAWGRCTRRVAPDGTGERLYLHVFERPDGGVLRLPGLLDDPTAARLLAAPGAALPVGREDPAVTVTLPATLPDADATVVELVFAGETTIVEPPTFDHPFTSFVDETVLRPAPPVAEDLVVRYTLDKKDPTADSPVATEGIPLDRSAVVTAQVFRGDRPVSEISRQRFERAEPRTASAPLRSALPGWIAEAYEGKFKKLPDFDGLTPRKTAIVNAPSPRSATRREHAALRFTGRFEAPADGIYRFTLTSDDGSALDLGGTTLIDHDGLHSRSTRTAEVALEKGSHPVSVRWFNATGSATLEVWVEGPGLERTALGAPFVRHRTLAIIPVPKQATIRSGTFRLGSDTRLVAGMGTEAAAARWAEVVRRSTGYPLPIRKADAAKTPPSVIELRRVKDGDMPAEAYRLDVSPTRAVIEAAGDAGLFYGTVTLRQLFPPAIERPEVVTGVDWIAPCCRIVDAPRFPWRGLMVDSCRHFQPKAWILALLERMAYYKLNRFHWHLTEDEAWRLEIRKYPELTRVGAWRGDGAYRYGGYFTQNDVREVVARATELHITVVPEIEMPGHCSAALVARPSVSCAGKPIPTGRGGLRHFTAKVPRAPYCAGREETFTFLEDVLTETLALFPSPWIHIGGDERPRGAWKSCESCQKRIRDEKLANEDELQSWFVRRIERFLNGKGRRLIGWDEILEGGLAPNATVMSWRGVSGGLAAARTGHDVIMSPTSHCYFDYWSGDTAVEPAGRGHRITPQLVYDFEPIPEALESDAAAHVLGAQANVWTEYLRTPELVEYMTFPRILALAEVVWAEADRKSWDGFRSRLGEHYARLAALGVRFRVPPPVGLKGMNLIAGETTLELESPVPGGVIRWVRGRHVPNQDARRYAGPIPIEEETAITARLYLPDGRASRPVTGRFTRAVWHDGVDPGETAPGLDLAYFEGTWKRCAELKRENPVRRGVQAGIGLPAGHRPEHFGCVLSGFLRIQEDGIYTFGLTSDDGSRLHIGGRQLIGNDGLHGSRERTAQAALRAGYHPIRVEYFQAGGAAKLLLTIEGGGLETQPMQEGMLVR